MIDTPQILRVPAQRMAAIRLRIPRSEIRQVMGPGLAEIRAALAAQGITAAGPWLTHHFSVPADEFDFEICVPADSAVQPVGRVTSTDLPAATVARTVYHGSYEGLGNAWGEFKAWIASNGHQTGPGIWECYLAGPDASADPASWRTQLNQPLLPDA